MVASSFTERSTETMPTVSPPQATPKVEAERSISACRSEKSCGVVDSGSDMVSTIETQSESMEGPSMVSTVETQSESMEGPSQKKLISKPILDGKTCTTILYEIVASIEDPISIKYFQIDNVRPRDRDTRFKIECHLNDKLYGTGEGSSKKAAKQLASKSTLEQLLEERPHLREDLGRVRKGYPSRKKVHTRRRQVECPPNWNRRDHSRSHMGQNFSNPTRRPNNFDPFFEMQERRQLAMEFEAVNRMVANIEHLASYVGFDDITPYERSLLNEHPHYYDASDFQRALIMDDFERSLYGGMEPVLNQPDTFEFMRKMQARASKKTEQSKFSKLNVQAQEFKPSNYLASEY